MSAIMPHSELLRRAVSYVNDTLQDSPEKKLATILDEASMRFNLSPLDAEALQRLFATAGSASVDASKSASQQ